MMKMHRIALIGALVGLFMLSGSASAADAADEKSKDRDAVCTRCHDENDNAPILAIYQTRHGVKADARTPSCQSCHGPSEDHLKNPLGVSPRPQPEVVFGTRHASAPDAQNSSTARRPVPPEPFDHAQQARRGQPVAG